MGTSSQLMIWQMLTIACAMNLPLDRNRVVEDMQNLDRMKDEFADVQIPVAVLRYVFSVGRYTNSMDYKHFLPVILTQAGIQSCSPDTSWNKHFQIMKQYRGRCRHTRCVVLGISVIRQTDRQTDRQMNR